MKYTRFNYYLEKPLVAKFDKIIERVESDQPKKDAVIIMEGGEGEGKTNSSIASAYYMKEQTGRPVHLFFRLDKMITFAQHSERQIIIWDEPSLDALSVDHYKEMNKNLIRLLMTARKKQHVFIFNFTKFFKFSEYIVVDRAICLIHMYSYKELYPGRFCYIRKKYLEALYNNYRRSKKRSYWDLRAFNGAFPEVMEKHFNDMGIHINGRVATLADYESEKNAAINSIGVKVAVDKPPKRLKSDIRNELELKKLRKAVGSLRPPFRTMEELANSLHLNVRTLRSWGYLRLEGDNDALEGDGVDSGVS